MESRIKLLRKKIGLTQEEFGKKMDLTRSSLANIESGYVRLTDRNFKKICEEFNVNPEWLKTGEGEMFNTVQEDKELLDFVVRILANKNEFVKNTFLTLARLDNKEWEVVEKIIKNLKK